MKGKHIHIELPRSERQVFSKSFNRRESPFSAISTKHHEVL